MEIEFEHRPAAHCEIGVICNMLRHYGFDLPEPLVFGLSYGLFFSHMPFVKLAGLPVTSYRTFPGVLFSRVTRMLGFKMHTRRFLNQEKAMKALDQKLAEGIPVGCVVGMYYLPYMPIEYRFPFNGHNICIIGRSDDGETYTVSDPNATEKVHISRKDLQKVRFTKGGTYPLLGQMYWIERAPAQLPDLKPLVLKAIGKNCWYMTSQPSWLPYFGVNGIDCLAKQVRLWPAKYGPRKAGLNLAQVIRMLEEIGTGGAGFRYMYGAFLQLAAKMTGREVLNDYSRQITEIGDKWRAFAADAAAIFKHRAEAPTYDQVADQLVEIGKMERNFFTSLKQAIK